MGRRKELQVLTVFAIFAAVAVIFARITLEGFHRGSQWYILATNGLLAALSIIGSVVCLDIWRLKPADSHTLHTLLSQYCALLKMKLKAPYIRAWIEKTTSDIKGANQGLLMKILRDNQNSQYGQAYKFSDIHSQEDFVRIHPIKRSEDYQNYMHRIMQGEKDVLYSGETHFMAKTSGTTGKQKVLAIRRKYLDKIRWLANEVSLVKLLPVCNLQRYAQFHIFSKLVKTSAGIYTGALSQLVASFPCHNLIPAAYSQLHDENQSYYAQALFSIIEPELQYINVFSADLAYSYFKYMTSAWQKLCDDIENGYIGRHVNMPENVRQELSKQLSPNPIRANHLRRAMEMGTCGLAKRIWPNMDYILMAKSAAFRFCARLVSENWFKGINIVAYLHGATEGFTGLNLDDEPNIGIHTLIPYPAFIEFIPLEDTEQDHPKTVFPEELIEGSLYEIVHTNENGVYRCRYGDIIQVVGFKNKAPKYQFLYRLGQRLNIAYERTPDKFLLEAVRSSEANLPPGIKLVNYTTTESTVIGVFTGNISKGHYVFFMELDTNSWIDMRIIASQIEKTLLEIYEPYQRFKDVGSIGTLEILQVEIGTFDELKSYIWNDTPHGQFKMPRVVRKDSAIKYLLGRVIHMENTMEEG